MSNSIGAIAGKLVNNLKTSDNIEGIRTFYILTKSNLKITINVSESETLKNIGILYCLMLKDEDFELDPDERQLMAAIGYCVLSQGVKVNSDKIGIPTNPLEWLEFLKLRILLVLHSKASIKYCLAMRPDREVDLHWTPLSNNRYQKEHEALTKMVISDAAEIKSWSESELISVMANTFQPESIKLANQILNANSNIINSSNFEELIFSGRVIHTSLFSFLKSKFEDKTSITKEQFIDE